jgi:hypothetical protein
VLEATVEATLARIEEKYVAKRADVLTRVQDFIAQNPEAQTALIGAGVGGVGGLLSSMTRPKSKRTPISDTLTGAAIGAGVGGLGHLAHDTYIKAREAPRPIQIGDKTLAIPRELLRDQNAVKELANLRDPTFASTASDTLGKGLSWLWNNKAVPGGVLAGEAAYQGLTSTNLPGLRQGLGDYVKGPGQQPYAGGGLGEPLRWLKNRIPEGWAFGPTMTSTDSTDSIFRALNKSLAGEGQFGPTLKSTLRDWYSMVSSDPDYARSQYGFKGKGPLSGAEFVNALRSEIDNPNLFTRLRGPNSSPITAATLDTLADTGRAAGPAVEELVDGKAKVKTPKAPIKFRLGSGSFEFSPKWWMRPAAMGTGLAGGLFVQDAMDYHAREQKLKDLLARKLVPGE